MVDVAHWFSRYGLLGIWRKPNVIHLISTDDFIAATKSAIYHAGVEDIYHLGDEGVQTLAEFLDLATKEWGSCLPWQMPVWMIRSSVWMFERISALTGCHAPLTQDFITIVMASYYGDTARMRQELLP